MATAKSWLLIPKGSPFSLANIPFGIISTGASSEPRPAIAVGDYALDLSVFSDNDGFAALADSNAYVKCWNKTTLNEFAALGRQANQKVRAYLQEIFSSTTPYPQILKDNKDLRSKALIPLKEVINHLALQIGDYSDFFAGYYHAMKAIQVYDVKLAANFMHIPVGYNGRSAAVVVSGTPIHRPHGQFVETPGSPPVFGPTKQLDFEVELGCFVGKPSAFGEPIRVDDGEDHIFGLVLLNDWSARDIQAWEMPPLGPVNGKSFGTTISPWVVLADAFEQFRAPSVENKTPLLPYLRQQRKDNVYDIRLEARLTSKFQSPAIQSDMMTCSHNRL